MKFLSLEAFVPSGKYFEISKSLFRELGFNITWDAGGMPVLKKMVVLLSYNTTMIRHLLITLC